MSTPTRYLNPELIRQVSRLDLRARFIVEGFFAGLHRSPFHGFSVEFSEHRRYVPGDDLKSIDWNLYARTDRFYVKQFQAETNVTGFLVMDLSASMGYTRREQLTKFEYCICLAAALAYLMIHQQDSVGLIAFDRRVRKSLQPRAQRRQLGAILALLAQLRPTGRTDFGASLQQIASMIRHRSLVILLSDFLPPADAPGSSLDEDLEPILRGLRHLRHGGHDVIAFHVLDQAEETFPFDGVAELEDNESQERLRVDARSVRGAYLDVLAEYRARLRRECLELRMDYVALHTGMSFDRALTSYLISRSHRF
jgi:uncharacterized protein (DUF58 family)